METDEKIVRNVRLVQCAAPPSGQKTATEIRHFSHVNFARNNSPVKMWLLMTKRVSSASSAKPAILPSELGNFQF
jgi:hypothetical protein